MYNKRDYKRKIMAFFTAAEYTCQSCIYSYVHTVQLFTGVTTAFCNQTHTSTFSGLVTTTFSENPSCVSVTRLVKVVCYDKQCERAALLYRVLRVVLL
jgi:hypothetical protein